jgi:hypothetical protein
LKVTLVLFASVLIAVASAQYSLAQPRVAAQRASIAKPSEAETPTLLPLRRVILYSNGVAYFERSQSAVQAVAG